MYFVWIMVIAVSAVLLTFLCPSAEAEPAVRAVDFESREIYRSEEHPSYTCWAQLFPGERGQWYLAFDERTRSEEPLAKPTRQWWYEMGQPAGYESSQYRCWVVVLESTDSMGSWQMVARTESASPGDPVTSRKPMARTKDEGFLAGCWASYAYDPAVKAKANEVLYQSSDNCHTWKKLPPLHDPHFISYPYHVRALHDGVLVLICPLSPPWGPGTSRPTRISVNLDAVNEMQMALFFSHDQGRTWQGPLPIFPGQTVSETDFVELPSGNLLFFNNSIFATPGRQFVYRHGDTFTPGPMEKVRSGTVPETVVLTKEGILVGCMRAGAYYWSDDLGLNWHPLEGAPNTGEVYQPWMAYLDDGRIACAGHYGGDDPVQGDVDHYISIQFFRLEVLHKTRRTNLWVERDFNEETEKWRNTYTITLTADDEPLADKEVEFWYVERYQPGYDSWNSKPLAERMEMGGDIMKAHTGPDGKAHVVLPQKYDGITNIHLSYQFVVRFNADRADPDYQPAQSAQLEFYAYAPCDLPAE